MSNPIVLKSISKLPIPWYYKVISPLFNLIGEKQTFRIVVTGPDYTEFNFLFGLFKYERGEKYEFIIQGTEKFAEIVTTALMNNGFNIE